MFNIPKVLAVGFPLAAFMAIGLFAAPDAGSPPAITFTFIGNMAFHATDGETVLLTDFPYESGAFGYMKWQAQSLPAVRNGLALVTHRHRDHFAPELLASFDVTVAGPREVLDLVKTRPTVSVTEGLVFRGLEITPRPTPHADVEHLSYVVVWHGQRLYFTGDTEDPADLLATHDLGAAFVSPWLLRSIAKRGARIDARRVIVYHHADGETVVAYGDRMVPRRGESIVLTAR